MPKPKKTKDMFTSDKRDKASVRTFSFIVVGMALSCLTFANAISNITAKSNPSFALSFWPNGEAQLAQSDRLLNRLEDKKVRAELASLTEASVRDYTLNAGIIRNHALAISYDQPRESARSLDVAERVSRRDLGTQLALASNAAKRNDIDAALRHFDIALRTNVSSHQLVFPILSKVIDDRAGADSLANVLAGKPLWANDFISFMLAKDDGAESIARILRLSNGVPAGPQKASMESRLIQALANDGATDELKAFYLSLKNSSSYLLTSADINPHDFVKTVPPISWSMTRSSDIVTEITENQRGLEIQLGFERSGVIAQKMLFLSAGAYRISMDSQFTGQEFGASLVWNLFCVSKSAPLRLVTSNISTSADVSFDGSCPAQLLEIRGNGGSGPDGSTGLISGFDIRRSV